MENKRTIGEHEWRTLILSKIEKIEEGQDSMVQMLHIHTLDTVKETAKIKQNHASLKDKVTILWAVVVFALTTIVADFITKKI